ncbi:hypothetical protein VOLCADRAFT_104523 [Volvox carteri f. nagariensis]|uniref:DSBA-like thioredoxin domain-containing protein n=1 Tax=Volvox carteri f. nagariensis TaxID=3068 RepID=D8TU70_VOLCA|nr:uncharacterized protein VOLCADRAFT_104523 [Volvox carteri f. nagariensis]EFJ49094.1 hypothetical protein VOLCADRAFT_104523 [Volvox carteri f. nagariensis]|eukprot:XP_002949991.1 hypothetical protein VOLCADRAFT_104523 [Volvox carteri f. nagariensis]
MIRLPEALPRPGPAQASQRSGPLPPVTVHVFNDIACPWCHIGARRLQRAVRQYKRRFGQAAPVKLQWNPLLVDSEVMSAGEEVNSYAQRRWGLGSVDPLHARLVRAGLPEGATFSNWTTMPNSLMALELISLAADMGLAEQASDLLFARTYELGGNVSLLSELLDIGESLGMGMSRGDLGRELTRSDGDSLRAGVLERDATAKRSGSHSVCYRNHHQQQQQQLRDILCYRLRIHAVPHFIISAGPKCRTKYSLNGAHQTSDLVGAMERVAMEEARAAAAATGMPYGGAVAAAAAGSTSSVLIAI